MGVDGAGVPVPTLANIVVGVLIVAVFVFMTLGGLAFLAMSLRRAVVAARLFAGSPTAASDVTSGVWTMVRGTARPGDGLVVAPISGDEVVCAHSRLEELRSSRRTTYWKPTYETGVTAPFRVADGTGTVPVDPVEPTIETGDDRTRIRTPDSPEAADTRIREFVADAPDVDGVPAGDAVRYAESLVQPGDEVLLFGRVGTARGRPTFGGGNDLTITTQQTDALVRDKAERALVYLFLSAIPLGVPVLFVVYFLVPYLFGG